VILPNADLAQIDPDKLRGYLLSTSHPIGRFKARFFGSLGFRADNWQELEEALRIQHLTQNAQSVGTDAYGQKYVRAILNGPNRQSSFVVSVWFIPKVGNVPRFVTASPGDTP